MRTLRFVGLALATPLLASSILLSGAANASAAEPIQLTLKDHRFTPDEITVPSSERFRIEIINQDQTPAEFESGDLRAEKIIVPGGKVSVSAGPLKPGTYKFFDDYHPEQARGTLTAVERQAKE